MNKVIINEEQCKGCNLCTIVCPKKILELSKEKINSKGFHPSRVTDMSKCIGCAFCAMICPDVVIEVRKEEE